MLNQIIIIVIIPEMHKIGNCLHNSPDAGKMVQEFLYWSRAIYYDAAEVGKLTIERGRGINSKERRKKGGKAISGEHRIYNHIRDEHPEE